MFLDVFPELLVCASLVFFFVFLQWCLFCDFGRQLHNWGSLFVFNLPAAFVLLAVGSSRFEWNESLSNLRKCHKQKSGGGVTGEKWQLFQTVFQHFYARHRWIFLRRPRYSFQLYTWQQNRYFKPKHVKRCHTTKLNLSCIFKKFQVSTNEHLFCRLAGQRNHKPHGDPLCVSLKLK